METPGVSGEVFNVACNTRQTLLDIAEHDRQVPRADARAEARRVARRRREAHAGRHLEGASEARLRADGRFRRGHAPDVRLLRPAVRRSRGRQIGNAGDARKERPGNARHRARSLAGRLRDRRAAQGGRRVSTLRAAARTRPQPLSPTVFVLAGNGHWVEPIRQLGIEVREIPGNRSTDPGRLRRARRAHLRSARPHVLHTILWSGNSYGRLAAIGLGIPLVITAERNVIARPPWQIRLERLLDRWTDCYLVNSQAIADTLMHAAAAARRLPNPSLAARSDASGRSPSCRRRYLVDPGRSVSRWRRCCATVACSAHAGRSPPWRRGRAAGRRLRLAR